MPTEDDDYVYVRGTYRYPKGSAPEWAGGRTPCWQDGTSDDEGVERRGVFIPDDDELRAQTATEPDISALVPLALVVLAVGFVGRIAKRLKDESESAKTAPAGWYELSPDAPLLRYWDGASWTDDFAERDATAAPVPADWYPDPASAGQVRYWDGRSWTHYTERNTAHLATPADWYPDPMNPRQLRYWDGKTWTDHVSDL